MMNEAVSKHLGWVSPTAAGHSGSESAGLQTHSELHRQLCGAPKVEGYLCDHHGCKSMD